MRMAGGRELPACMATKVCGVAAGQAEAWVGEYGWGCWGRERGCVWGYPACAACSGAGHREHVSRACAPWQKAQACSKEQKAIVSVIQSACKALDACQSLCLAHGWVTPATSVCMPCRTGAGPEPPLRVLPSGLGGNTLLPCQSASLLQPRLSQAASFYN